MTQPFISKSKYLVGLQCSKLLWHHYNAKDKIPETDASTQAIFDQGHQVGELAKTLYADGIEIDGDIRDFEGLLASTSATLKQRKSIFEGAFRYENAYSRVDILHPVARDAWDIIEVKSSTKVKEINLHDLALQLYAYDGCGLNIRKTYLMHINNKYVRKGEVEPVKLFALEDVTNEVRKLLPDVEPNLTAMADVIRQKDCPGDSIGPQCSNPYECALQDVCWNFLPVHNVFTLPRFGSKAFKLAEDEIYDLHDIPDDYRLTDGQQIVFDSVKLGKPHVDMKAIAKFLSRLEYPLYYLDFETFSTAIPLFDDVKPYQQIPFQFSLHIVKSPGAAPEHHSFLAEGRNDPRKEFLAKLMSVLGTKGSVVCYNASFEATVLKELATLFPSSKKWVALVKDRIVDLFVPFRCYAYYHPDQKGNASIKAVLPALTGSGYENMEIADGGTASLEFLRVTFGDASRSEREKVRIYLERYCKLDTLGMHQLVVELEKCLGQS